MSELVRKNTKGVLNKFLVQIARLILLAGGAQD